MKTPRVLLTTLLSPALACSVMDLPYTPCATDDQCQSAFGLGSVCGDAGYCDVAEVSARCDLTAEDAPVFPALPDDVLVMASIFDQEGDNGRAQARASALVAAEVNDKGGLGGLPVALLRCSNEANAAYDSLEPGAAAAALASQLVGELGIKIMLGPGEQDAILEAFPAVNAADALMIASTDPSNLLTGFGGPASSESQPGQFWRAIGADAAQGEMAAFDMLARGLSDVGLIVEVGSYGDGISEAFETAFKAGGGAVADFSFTDTTDLSAAIAQAADHGYEEIFFISAKLEDNIAFLQGAVADGGFGDATYFLTRTAANIEVFGPGGAPPEVGPLSRGATFAPAADLGGDAYDTCRASYVSAFGGESPDDFEFAANAYDAAWLAVSAAAYSLGQEGAVTAKGVGLGLRHLSSGEPTPLGTAGWPESISDLMLGGAVDVVGASGPLDFDLTTRQVGSPMAVWAPIETGPGVLYTCDLSATQACVFANPPAPQGP